METAPKPINTAPTDNFFEELAGPGQLHVPAEVEPLTLGGRGKRPPARSKHSVTFELTIS